MTRTLLENCRLLDPERGEPAPGSLLVEEGRIAARLAPGEATPGAERVDLAGRLLAPGFLDLHFHGRLVFAEPAAYPEVMRETGARLLRHGTTGYLATTVAWPAVDLAASVDALTRVIADAPAEGASILGIHLEGPWIRPEAAGAQPARGIRPYDAAEGSALLDRAEGAVRMVTYAPEAAGARRLEAELARRGVVAALGHSLADEGCVMDALEHGGARHVTHLFNAMGGLHHRTRGLAGVALTEDRLSCDVICDGVHVHPAVTRLAARAKGEGLVLITDRVDPPPDADFGAGTVHEVEGVLRLPDGTLAGSALTLDRAVRNAVAFGAMTLPEAVAAVTLRPARLLGLEAERGTLRPGARADLVALDDAGRTTRVWLGGRAVAGPA